MSSSQPAFVFIPGSFSSTYGYHKVVDILKAQGYTDIHNVELESVNESRSEPATMADDASTIHETLAKLSDQGKDIVMAMSSYGGFPGSEACKGLSKTERGASGNEGGVVALVYIASFLAPVGASLTDMLSAGLPPTIKDAQDAGRPYMDLNRDEDWKGIFNDLGSDEEKKGYMSMMGRHSTVSFSGKLTYPAYKHIPSTYIHTKNDMIVPPPFQLYMIDAAKQDGADIKVVELDSGHVPVLSFPDQVVKILLDAGKGSVGT